MFSMNRIVSKSLKVTGIVLGVVLLAVVIGLIWLNCNAGRLAKEYVEENSDSLIGRKVTIGQIDVHLLKGEVQIDSLTIKEKDRQTDFVYFDSLYVKVGLWKLLGHKLSIEHIHLNGADAVVKQRASVFNFSDIIDKFSSDSDTTAAEEDTTPGFVREYEICDIQLNGCSVHYADLLLGSKFNLNHVNLGVPAIYFSDKSTDVGLHLNFDEGGSLNARMLYDINTSKFDITAKIEKFPITGVEPYMRSGVRVGSLTGKLDVDAHMVGDFEHIMNFDLSGSSSLNNLCVRDDKNRLVFSAEKTTAVLKNLNLSKNEIHLGLIDGKNMKTQFVMDKNGENNFTYFTTMSEDAIKNKEERQMVRDSVNEAENKEVNDSVEVAEQKDESRLKLLIDSVNFSNLSVDIHDGTLDQPFDYKITHMSTQATNFTLDGVNNVRIKANMGKTGTAFLHWRGSIDDLKNQNIVLNLTNIDLSEFTPYMLPMFGYRIESGNCSLISQNVLTNNNLNGSNLLNIFNCKVEKDKSIENPEVKAPLKTALYIIKDKDGKISFDVPVTGNLDNPEFSYKKIILKTLTNLLVKVATSPFKSLGKLLGISHENVDEVPLSPTVPGLDVESYDKLNQVAIMLKDKPDMVVTFNQQINYTDAIKKMAVFELKKNYYMTSHPEKANTKMELLDWDAIRNIADKDEGLVAYAESQVADASVKSIEDKAMKLYQETAITEIGELAQRHNKIIVDYLVNTQGLNAEKLKMEVEPYDASKKYSGKSIIKLDIPEE